jgi:hypothetical protein
VWHASTAGPAGRNALRGRAFAALDGVGDPLLGEWEEWTGRAYHLRRRLTSAEAAPIGPAVDVRGTLDGACRFHAIRETVGPGIADQVGEQ